MYLYLIEKPEKPKGYFVFFSHLRVVSGINGIVIISNLVRPPGIANAKLPFPVYDVELVLATLANQVVFPQCVDEKRFHGNLFVGHYGIDGVHQVGVVHHYLRWFLWKIIANKIHHVDKSRIGQVLNVVHHRCPACFYVLCKLADVRCFRWVERQQVE